MLKSALIIMLCSLSFQSSAETLVIPVGQQKSPVNEALPLRGQSQAYVLLVHGQPDRQLSVGEPPITRWFYPEFSVYFEGEHVIHSVTHFKAQHPQ